MGIALRHRSHYLRLSRGLRSSGAAAVVCVLVSMISSRLAAQEPTWWEAALSRPHLFDRYLQDRDRQAPPWELQWIVDDQAESLSSPPEASDDAELSEYECDPLESAPPGALAMGGVRRWFQHTPFFGHGIEDVRDPRRHFGVGVPLEGTSWRNRPWRVGVLVGFLDGGEVANGTVLQDSGMLWGVRLGHDFDHYWGWELRAATSQNDLNRLDTGVPLPQNGRNSYYDVSLMYYPLGDTRWRPYFSLGVGAATHGFADVQGNSYDETTASLPLGIGIKYFVRPGTSIRADFTNNISLGTTNAPGTDNISLTLGLDLHFGGRRRVYYPWDSSIQVW